MKKRVLSLLLALGLCLGLLPTAVLAVEITITEVLPPTYKHIGTFSGGLAAAQDESGKWGFIDITGKVVIPFQYTEARAFSEGFAAVKDENWRWAYIDTTGRAITPFKYRENCNTVASFSEGFALVQDENWRWGYIDTTGKEVIPCKYSSSGGNEFERKRFSGGLAVVQIGAGWTGKYGYIDTAGTEVIPCKYDSAGAFSDGLAVVSERFADGCGYIDTAGKEIVPCGTYDMGANFSEGFARVRDKESKKYGFIDTTGKEIVPCKYDLASSFSEGFAAVRIGDNRTGRWGYIDTTGKEVIPCQYPVAGDFSGGFAAVENMSNQHGLIGTNGNTVVPFGKYRGGNTFSEGVIRVVDEDWNYGLIDIEGNELVPCKYDNIGNFSEGFAVICDEDNRYGFLAIGDGSTPVVPSTPTAYASTQTVLVDGKPVVFSAYALKDANGNDTNYVKLRDVAQILNGSAAQFEVGWDGSIAITTHAAYTPNGSELIQNFTGDQSYTVNSSPVKVNGVETGLEAITLTDSTGGGFTYFKLRDLGSALDFVVDWNATDGIIIKTK